MFVSISAHESSVVSRPTASACSSARPSAATDEPAARVTPAQRHHLANRAQKRFKGNAAIRCFFMTAAMTETAGARRGC
jgi:hypothetical protein